MSNRQRNRKKKKSALPQASNQQPVAKQPAGSLFLTRTRSVTFQGPLPPPEILQRYNDVMPNGAERIVAMAEKNQNHRHGLEASVIKAGIRNETLGQVLAFILYLAVAAAGVYLITAGHGVFGLALLLGETAAFAVLFMYAKRAGRQQLVEKRDRIDQL